jgi:hypothetical protein
MPRITLACRMLLPAIAWCVPLPAQQAPSPTSPSGVFTAAQGRSSTTA